MLQEIIEKHSGEIYGYLCRFLGSSHSAEDILSEVYVSLIEQQAKCEDEAFRWRPWLYRVATNLAISHMRKQKIRGFLFPVDEHRDESLKPAPEMLAIGERDAKIRTAVEGLGKRHKPVVIMKYFQDMSLEEIAAALDISVGTVKSRLNEAKRRLEIALSEVANEPG